ncbi:MAG TPA: hypothetical protein VM864_07130 [Pyrinomonadaceae bacterium]|jgi:hypothetical protein|nr:hypothetical protein [Pyrinomonadaceae bacterium]
MHDCTRTKERLIDLAFDEAPDAARLRAEVESCPGCRAEYRALAETLDAYGRAADAVRPSENFWAGYHARLAARLDAPGDESLAPPRAAPSPDPLHRPTASLSPTSAGWIPPAGATRRPTPTTARLSSYAARLRRVLSTTWRVPAPAAVAAALLVVCLSILAARPAPAPLAVESPSRADIPVEVRTVEVPVVREKIVTRTVYVARGEGPRADRSTRAVRVGAAQDLARAGGGDGAGSHDGADKLAGFRPASDAKLRVIKGNFANEK